MASRSRIPHPSVDQRRARGQEARNRAPLSKHGRWAAVAERPDPVRLLEEQDAAREPDPVPVRHGRMLVSPFTFYRGAAKLMAADLDGTPTAGLNVQLCGDAHLSSFGLFASPERRLLFDLNDFDETLPGPFEYDVKRLAASLTVAARNNGFTKADTRAVTRASVAAWGRSHARRPRRPGRAIFPRRPPTYKMILAGAPEAMPANWEATRQRYFTINWIQLAITWAAFALFLVALVTL